MTVRRPWVGTSWKMNKTRAEAVAYLRELVTWTQHTAVDADVTVFPPFTALDACAPWVHTTSGPATPRLRLGAQNAHWWPAGAQTGEISVPMLLDVGVDVVEIGHLERRTHHGETDATVQAKVAAVTAAGLDAVVCVGESAGAPRGGVSELVLDQVRSALTQVDPGRLGQVVVAYEPGWAIGTGGRAARPEDVVDVLTAVRDELDAGWGDDGRAVRTVYGGSVDAHNAASFREVPVDGLFVGRAALTTAGLVSVVEAFVAADPSELATAATERTAS